MIFIYTFKYLIFEIKKKSWRSFFIGIRKICIINEEDLLDEFFWEDSLMFHYKKFISGNESLNIIIMNSFPNQTKKYPNLPFIVEISIVSSVKINQYHLEMCETFKTIARQLSCQWLKYLFFKNFFFSLLFFF